MTQISGLISEYIVEIDRSSVFYWLATCSEMQRKTFLDVLVDVHNTKNKMNALNPCGWSHLAKRLTHKCQSKDKMQEQYPTEVGPRWPWEIFFQILNESDLCPSYRACSN